MSFESYEVNGYMHNLDLLIIMHLLHTAYCMESGVRRKTSKQHTYTLYLGKLCGTNLPTMSYGDHDSSEH